MYLLSIILLIIFLLILLVVLVPLKISFSTTSYNFPNLNVTFSWIYPFLKGTLNFREETLMTFKLFIFKKLIKKDFLTFEKNFHNKYNLSLLKNFKPKSIEIKTSYGFHDPWLTGVVCGILNLIPQYVKENHIYNNPNFNTDDTYFNVNGLIKISLASILLSFLKNRQIKTSYANK